MITQPVETFTTIRNGEYVTLHRCPNCAKREWYATGKPPIDNGFMLASKPIPHHAGCPNKPR